MNRGYIFGALVVVLLSAGPAICESPQTITATGRYRVRHGG
jgi:hypothetical protein